MPVQEKMLTSLKEEYNLHVKTRDVLVDTLRVYLSATNGEINRSSYDNVKLLNDLPTEYSTDVIENRPDFKQ